MEELKIRPNKILKWLVGWSDGLDSFIFLSFFRYSKVAVAGGGGGCVLPNYSICFDF